MRFREGEGLILIALVSMDVQQEDGVEVLLWGSHLDLVVARKTIHETEDLMLHGVID